MAKPCDGATCIVVKHESEHEVPRTVKVSKQLANAIAKLTEKTQYGYGENQIGCLRCLPFASAADHRAVRTVRNNHNVSKFPAVTVLWLHLL